MLSKIPPPKTTWCVDKHGNELPYTTCAVLEDGMIFCRRDVKIANSVFVEPITAKWPVRFLNRLIEMLPPSWHGQPTHSFTETFQINFSLPLINKLVKYSGMTFNEASIASSIVCKRCKAAILSNKNDKSWKKIKDCHCEYCQHIDEKYHQKYRAISCYKAMKFGGDISRAFKTCVYSIGDVDVIEPRYCSHKNRYVRWLTKKLYKWSKGKINI